MVCHVWLGRVSRECVTVPFFSQIGRGGRIGCVDFGLGVLLVVDFVFSPAFEEVGRGRFGCR